MKVAITIDLEHDCPPFLHTYRGMEEGAPRFFDLVEQADVPVTCFTTGDVARRYPDVMRRIVDNGHELGCHGDTHKRFSMMDAQEARKEIADSTATLRDWGDVTSFRAPNLDFPEALLPLLAEYGYALDSSLAAYKPHKGHRRDIHHAAGLLRVPASTMPSVIRLPSALRNLVLRMLKQPAVLFFHPWEFTDFSKAPIPFDCRYGTGDTAIKTLGQTIDWFKGRGAAFVTMRDVTGSAKT